MDMGSPPVSGGDMRFPSHQLSNGLVVSGRPNQQHKERSPTMGVSQMPYTGGDIKQSGELGKMFDIRLENSSPARPPTSGIGNSLKPGRAASSSHSGPIPSRDPSHSGGLTAGTTNSAPAWQRSNSGPLASRSGPLPGNSFPSTRQSSKSGPVSSFGTTAYGIPALPTTGLITSGPLSSSPITSKELNRRGQGDTNGAPAKVSNGAARNQAINYLSHDQDYAFRKHFPTKVILWTVIPLFVIGFVAGGFIIATVHNAILLIIVGGLFIAVVLLLAWNTWWGYRSVTGYLNKYPESDLGAAEDGQFVKVTGVVTCGSTPLQSSYLKINRCIYTSTGLYEYRSFRSNPVSPKQYRFTWGARHLEKHVVDFYISDLQSGHRALVKAGSGARVTAYVEESAVVDIPPMTKEVSPDFVSWLSERSLRTSERAMRLKEGCITEGSTVTVFGVVQRHENVLMIVPHSGVVSIGCQWSRLLLPGKLEGLILKCDDNPKNEGVPL